MKFTILGSTGFIGASMLRHLQKQGFEVNIPERNAKNLHGEDLGHVIYAIGLTGDFRENPDAAIEAHVHVLQKLMKDARFESWLYLSSTRVYSGLHAGTEATEETSLPVRPSADALYDLSKLLGESICLGKGNPAIRVARLSNVYGPGQSSHTFLGSIIAELKKTGKTIINESPESSKDYISIDDVTSILQVIATKGKDRLYNVASGNPVTHRAIADSIKKCGYTVDFSAKAPTRAFPSVNTAKIVKEFGINPRSVLQDLPLLLEKETKK